MDKSELRELLLERLHLEVQLFKDYMICRSKADIFAGSYKIEMYVNLYRILVRETEGMQEPLLRKLLYQGSGILDTFYVEWLTRADNFYMELRDYVEDELNAISDSGML